MASSGTTTPFGRRDAAIAGVAGLAACLVYLPALSGGFVADDFFLLDRVRALGGLGHPLAYFHLGFFEYYRPLGFLSQALDRALWGANAAGFHLTNVLLHAISTMLVFVLGRRLMDRPAALVGALLFALHPASHEAVYWIAARFDLLATCFTLAALACLWRDGAAAYVAGVACFGLALLSKESALSLPVMAAACDVLIRDRDWRSTARRLVPLLALAALYAALRSQGADVSLAGGARRLPKFLMMGAALAGLLWVARTRMHRHLASAVAPRRRAGQAAALAVAAGAILALALWWPPTAARVREPLNFVAYAAFYLVSPIVRPAPPPYFLDPATTVYAVGGIVVVTVGLFVAWLGLRWWSTRPGVLFLIAFVAAALLPVSSMTGGTRYLYLASAGSSLLAGLAFSELAKGRGRRLAVAVVLVAILGVSWAQVRAAGRAWQWASEMTAAGVALMSADLAPCDTKDVVLLTAPVGIEGVYCNFYWEAFGVSNGCSPATFHTVLRVVRLDAHVEVTERPDGILELRVSGYRGNIVMSRDLSHFDRPVPRGDRATVDLPIGRLETMPDGDAQVFRLTLDARARQARLYYYSDGRIHAVRPRG
jgi:4-amino-4-deoxy-L-arabinose transferase-like glycosyltransferase